MAVRGDSLVYCRRRPAGLGKAIVSAGLSHPLYCPTHKDTQTERCGRERECAGAWYSALTSTRGQLFRTSFSGTRFEKSDSFRMGHHCS